MDIVKNTPAKVILTKLANSNRGKDMKKVFSGFFERLNSGESFWVALPAKTIRQMSIGLLADTMCAGGIMELNQKDLKKHNKMFYGDGKKEVL